MPIPYSLLQNSIRNKKPEMMRNGDFILTKYFDDEDLLLLALADGVGSTHEYWIASQMACEGTVKFFAEYDISDKSISTRLAYSVEQACDDVYSSSAKKGSGMLSTLCSVVWNLKEDKIFYTSIGDSRIYKYSHSKGLKQLTNDQIYYQQIIENGKPLIVKGSPQTRKMLSNAVGQKKSIIDIFEDTFLPSEAIIICSDGVYEKLDMDFEAKRLFESSDMKESFESLNIDIDSQNEDDATLIVLRRNDFNTNAETTMPDYIKLIFNIQQLENNFVGSNKSEILKLLKRIFELNIKLSKHDFSRIMVAWGNSKLFQDNDTEINAELFKLRKKL